jgi:hypothetical protein
MSGGNSIGTIGTRAGQLGRPSDSVALRGGANELAIATERLERIGRLLDELKSLSARGAEEPGGPDRQGEIDGLIASIEAAAAEVAIGRGFEHIAVTNVSDEVVSYDITKADLDSPFDVEIRVRQSAQQGGLFLSMGQTVLDIGTGSSFTIEIGGAKGAHALAFTSSQSLASIAAAINSKSGESGVMATLSGTGIAIRSSGFGSQEFVSVRMLDDGGVGDDENIGIYQLDPKNTNSADPSHHDDFDGNVAGHGIEDAGQDIVAAIGGSAVVGDGARLTFATPEIAGTIELSTGPLDDARGVNAQNLGDLTAMTVSILKTGANQGAGAHAPEPPDLDLVEEQVRSRLEVLERLRAEGATRLPAAMVRWLGTPPVAGATDATQAGELLSSIRDAILRGDSVGIGADRDRILELLGGEAQAEGKTVPEVALAEMVLPKDELDRLLDPRAMTEPDAG